MRAYVRNNCFVLSTPDFHLFRFGWKSDFVLFSMSLISPEIKNIFTLHLFVFFIELNYDIA